MTNFEPAHFTIFLLIPDSPKLRNKGQNSSKSARPASALVGSTGTKHSIASLKGKTRPPAHNIVVVRAAAKQESVDKDPDLLRLQVSTSYKITVFFIFY